MIGVVVAAHGNIADALVTTAQQVLSTASSAAAVCLVEHDTSESFAEKLGKAIEEVDEGFGVLLLTDMFGGTPSNVALASHCDGKVEVVMGVNLPMLLKALELEEGTNLGAAAIAVAEAGHRAINSAGAILHHVSHAPNSTSATDE